MKKNERWQHYKFTAGSGYGVSDSWALYQRIEGKVSLLSGEKKVRAGRDTADRIARFYPQGYNEIKKVDHVTRGDRLKYNSEYWEVLFISDGIKKYLDMKAIQG